MSVSERRKALITGGSRGIGRAVAKALASEGYDLYLTCHEQIGRLDSLAEELRKKYGIKCYCYAFSICDEEKVIAMYQDIPYLDILVNNAGISYIGLLTEMTYQQWREVIDTKPGLYNEFQDSQSRIEKPCLKKGGRGSQKTSLTSLAGETRALSPCKNAH